MDKQPVSKELIEQVRQGFALPWYGIHGISHWVRVRENGLRLAKVTDANTDVVEFYQQLGWEKMEITLMGKTFDQAKKETC